VLEKGVADIKKEKTGIEYIVLKRERERGRERERERDRMCFKVAEPILKHRKLPLLAISLDL
jgi:hypothetical protein